MGRFKRPLYGKEGFTAIERMIVMVIILFLCVVSGRSMQRWNKSQQANRQEMAAEADSNRITPAMLRQQRRETAMVLQAVQAELRDEIR